MTRRYPSSCALLLLGVALSITPTTTRAQPSIPVDDKPIQLDGRNAREGYITGSASPIDEDLAQIEMLSPMLGLIDDLDARAISSINRLARLIDDPKPLGDPEMYLHMSRGVHSGTLALYPQQEDVLLQSLDDPSQTWSVRRDAFDRLDIALKHKDDTHPDWFNPTRDALEMTIPTPHVQSPVLLDAKTIRSRIKNNFPKLTRVLGNETFHVRLPKNFDPSTPSGVLVWISPTPSGAIHDSFKQACDELGLIAIGVDNNGNKRPITDRLQNHLDSIETLAQHARIDRERIYLTGMSGGGRCSGILQIAFPEHFAGAVPIVGLDTYHNAPTGTPNQYWPKAVGKPAGKWFKLLKERRIRSITGTADFNEPEMVKRTELLKQDGLNIEIDVIPGMAHTFPNAQQFRDALEWVDEPHRLNIEAQRDIALTTLEETKDQDPTLPAVRRKLLEIIAAIPYTDEAWEAASRLGYPEPEG